MWVQSCLSHERTWAVVNGGVAGKEGNRKGCKMSKRVSGLPKQPPLSMPGPGNWQPTVPAPLAVAFVCPQRFLKTLFYTKLQTIISLNGLLCLKANDSTLNAKSSILKGRDYAHTGKAPEYQLQFTFHCLF